MKRSFRSYLKITKVKFLLQSLLLTFMSHSLALAEIPTQTANFEALFQSEVNNHQIKPISDRLELGEHARGKFTQYRQLKVLKKPLVSHGSFIFDAQLGLAWKQERPFKSTLILKDNELIQIDSSGELHVSKASDNRGAGALAQTLPLLLKALLSGELETLDKHFHFYLLASSANAPWMIGLKPKDPLLLKAIPQLVLEGDEQVTALTLLSTNGDSSKIEFEEIDNQALSIEEQQQLSPTTSDTQDKSSQTITEPEHKPKTIS
ncbi:outer membrane lipoprotein carrier protein LolA [Shewanella eurypsychrophilus]|uniref:Outer membrane lipoprotein carrier protein LolA n=1 Tax=Shewanella eurypsychrophilus TaxID=2593656 RepID=A0ABX6VCG4_9GAMM|nr:MULTISPECIES: outer membrane lipoprotein carrier protein LolA [Shewanella]QFU24830.1 outer membrane lipoprotein carrier protein LolA [Shewanella sp. YLB-09]QPG60020.1 outer membrane lipoprotein carrier protein LolA [Shewanella eurypsychrophilus]